MLGLELLRVVDGVFMAEAVISADSTLLRVDCRPSDGVALALRCGARIQASDAVLAHAESAAEVIRSLPEHVRILARTRMSASPGQPKNGDSPFFPAAREFFRNPESGKGQTAAEPVPSPQRNRQYRIRAVSAPQEEKIPDTAPTLTVLKRYEKDARPNEDAAPVKQVGNIRISLVRQTQTGNLELVDEFCLPTKNAPKTSPSLPADPLAEAERILKNGGTEDERWAALLKVLSPETKVPM
jgi:hypothetical protein